MDKQLGLSAMYLRVTGNLSGDNFRIGILGLDNKLHTLDGGSCCLGNGSGNTSSGEILNECNSSVRHLRGSKNREAMV